MTLFQQQIYRDAEGMGDLPESHVIPERSIFDCLNIEDRYRRSECDILNGPPSPAPDCGRRQRTILYVGYDALRQILIAVRAKFQFAHDWFLRAAPWEDA